MSQQEKGELYRKLQAAGVEFSKHYREYTTDELREAVAELDKQLAATQPPPDPADELSPEEAEAFFGTGHVPEPSTATARMPKQPAAAVPVAERNPGEMPGQRLNHAAELQPIRQDEEGRIWYQEEVLKPSGAQPRARRVLDYIDTGTETKTVVGANGELLESFEVAGTAQRRPAQVKITLPSYQVGIYKDRRFPFKVHTYAGQQGFDLFEVQNYYGGAELVPTDIKRVYVENVLCYDIRTTVRAIQTEYNQLRLAGRVQ